jgi:uncharacterized protein YifN (PemK superfamily)
MYINFVPQRAQILICDYDLACIPPEMSKQRRVVVVSPRSYNRRHGLGAGRCVVVPFSSTAPPLTTLAQVAFPGGKYNGGYLGYLRQCELRVA